MKKILWGKNQDRQTLGCTGGSEGELDGVNVDVNQLGVTMTENPISRDQNQLVKPTAGEPEGY